LEPSRSSRYRQPHRARLLVAGCLSRFDQTRLFHLCKSVFSRKSSTCKECRIALGIHLA
jgi:hypothetical protein